MSDCASPPYAGFWASWCALGSDFKVLAGLNRGLHRLLHAADNTGPHPGQYHAPAAGRRHWAPRVRICWHGYVWTWGRQKEFAIHYFHPASHLFPSTCHQQRGAVNPAYWLLQSANEDPAQSHVQESTSNRKAESQNFARSALLPFDAFRQPLSHRPSCIEMYEPVSRGVSQNSRAGAHLEAHFSAR